MPLYTYKCDKCGNVFDTHVSIKNRNDTQHCPSCNGPSGRDVEAELKDMGNFNETMQDHPRWSWSMGIHRDRIPEMRKKFPDRNYHPKTGQLEVRNRKHKLQLMKEHGMEEY